MVPVRITEVAPIRRMLSVVVGKDHVFSLFSRLRKAANMGAKRNGKINNPAKSLTLPVSQEGVKDLNMWSLSRRRIIPDHPQGEARQLMAMDSVAYQP